MSYKFLYSCLQDNIIPQFLKLKSEGMFALNLPQKRLLWEELTKAKQPSLDI